jgi:hypothetical protein
MIHHHEHLCPRQKRGDVAASGIGFRHNVSESDGESPTGLAE